MAEFQRARSDGAKRSREADILRAAHRLGAREGVRSVTLTAIAAEVGMHKSGLLRYFETREQIFLKLAADEWVDWGTAVAAELRSATAYELGSVLASSLVSREFFCDLLGHVPLSLERNVSVASVRRYKLVTQEQVTLIGAALMAARPALTAQDTVDIVATAVATAGALWQMSTPGEVLGSVYRDDPQLRHAVVDLRPTLTRILTAVVIGLAAAPSSNTPGSDNCCEQTRERHR
jgi:AcrR family transcriptional regulator